MIVGALRSSSSLDDETPPVPDPVGRLFGSTGFLLVTLWGMAHLLTGTMFSGAWVARLCVEARLLMTDRERQAIACVEQPNRKTAKDAARDAITGPAGILTIRLLATERPTSLSVCERILAAQSVARHDDLAATSARASQSHKRPRRRVA